MAFSTSNLLADTASTFESGIMTWAAGTNTTLSIVTSEYLVGTRSLRMTATADGSVVATSPRFLVSAGKTYAVRLPIRQATSVVKVVTGRITWYDATSGGTALGTAEYSVSLNSSVGWYNANYCTPSGVAPTGAKSATVRITVTGLSAFDYVNTDDVYAAEIPRRAGDLMAYNTSSVENDVSGWTPETNSTLTRTLGTLYTGAGYYSLSVASVAAGVSGAHNTNFLNVTAGQDYVGYAAVQPTWAVSMEMRIHWYNSSNTKIGEEARTVSIAANAIVRHAVSGTAPVGAVKARVFLEATATAAGQVFYVDDASLSPAVNRTGNLLTFEEYSTESTLPTWTLSGGTGLARTYLTSGITDGFYALSYVPVNSEIHRMTLNRLIPITPGTTYQAKATFFGKNSSVQVTPMTYRVLMDWYDASGVLFAADNPDGFYSVNISPGGLTGATTTETRMAPAGAAYARVSVELDHTVSLVDRYYVDNVSLIEATPEYELVSDNATGSVKLTVNMVSASGTHVTIQRTDENGKTVYVRGYGQEWKLVPYTPGPLVIEDYEAPIGTRVQYSIRWTEATGAIRANALYTQQIKSPIIVDPDYAWFKAPGNPALNTLVLMETPLKWSRTSRSTRYDIVGRKNPIHVTGVRSGRSAGITILVWDPSANALFDSLLDAGQPVLIQAMPGYGVEGNLYLAIGDSEVEHVHPDARVPGWRWALDITEVDRPAGGLQGSAGITWQNIYDNYQTWEDVFDAHNEWVTVLTKG